MTGAAVTRRQLFAGSAAALLAACGKDEKFHATDVTGSSPRLAFTMTRASDGKTVTAADYRGSIVLLTFGYTNCPDVCPTTLANLADILDRLRTATPEVHALFVTVDPVRDSLALLKAYTSAFSPRIDGLRGTEDELAELARRYRFAYSVTPQNGGRPYEVTHSAGVYVFDGAGAARLLVGSLASANPDLAGIADDLRRVAQVRQRGLLARLLHVG